MTHRGWARRCTRPDKGRCKLHSQISTITTSYWQRRTRATLRITRQSSTSKRRCQIRKWVELSHSHSSPRRCNREVASMSLILDPLQSSHRLTHCCSQLCFHRRARRPKESSSLPQQLCHLLKVEARRHSHQEVTTYRRLRDLRCLRKLNKQSSRSKWAKSMKMILLKRLPSLWRCTKIGPCAAIGPLEDLLYWPARHLLLRTFQRTHRLQVAIWSHMLTL